MTYAAVVEVKIDGDSDVSYRHSILNDYVLPEIKALPGFNKGTWLNDGVGTGVCVVTFDTEEHAEAAVASLTRPGGPPEISSGVYKVQIEA
jgi:hypothetical protein